MSPSTYSFTPPPFETNLIREIVSKVEVFAILSPGFGYNPGDNFFIPMMPGSSGFAGFPGFSFSGDGVKFIPADVDSKKNGGEKQKNRGRDFTPPLYRK